MSEEKKTRSRRKTRKVKAVEPLAADTEIGIAGTIASDASEAVAIKETPAKSITEQIDVPVEHASETVKQALKKPGIRQIVIKNEDGKVIWQAHPFIGAGTGVLLLILAGLPGALATAAVAGIITLVGRVRIEITREA